MREAVWIQLIGIVTGVGFASLGMFYRTRKDKAVQPWANVKEPPKVYDVIKYNKAVGNLFIVYGLLMAEIIYLMTLSDLWALASSGIIMLQTIVLMIALVFVQNKYREKK